MMSEEELDGGEEAADGADSMTDERKEALRLLAEAVERLGEWPRDSQKCADLIGRIECLARAQPQQEPIGWLTPGGNFISADEVVAQNISTHNLRTVYLVPPAQAIPEGWVLVPREPTCAAAPQPGGKDE